MNAKDTFFRMADILDGSSNTILMGERRWPQVAGDLGHVIAPVPQDGSFPGNIIPANCRAQFNRSTNQYNDLNNVRAWPGNAWSNGEPGYSGLNTILPPNSPSCMVTAQTGTFGIHSAGSMHQGGCFVLMGDGSVQFVSDFVDAGNQGADIYASSMAGESPFGVWGALGSRFGGEAARTF